MGTNTKIQDENLLRNYLEKVGLCEKVKEDKLGACFELSVANGLSSVSAIAN